ncbi:hypothetical protein [uncultured Piscinibacter sp.]|uniref:hypothetical protein n=1 Tax=uncultured Piscinibacter sp. TaxID=1131835 RepID=UPI00261C90AA|nr:hypothetical protein [uncultured Piscinibacter sp.]
MDIFYYWKDYAADVKNRRAGRFSTSRERLAELKDGYPDFIWAFKTPVGRKGQLQLLARLVWSDKPPTAFRATPGEGHVFYDADHPESVWFDGGEEEAAIAGVSSWIIRHHPTAVSSNFKGVNGQHAMRGAVIAELVGLSKSLRTRQFNLAAPTEA